MQTMMHKFSTIYAQFMQNAKYAQYGEKNKQKYAKRNMQKNMQKICQKYAKNMPKIC